MWTKVKSSVKREISEKYLIFFYLVHTAALKGFVVKAFSISERRSDFMRIWEKIASRHFCAVKIFSRIFFKIYSNIFNSLSSKVCFVMKIFERKFIQIFSIVCLRTFFCSENFFENIFSNIFNSLSAKVCFVVKMFERKIYSNIFNSLPSKVCFVMKIFERENLFKYFQLFACGHFLR